MTTTLRLRNMVFYGYHGVYSAEKELGQRIEVDVELVADLTGAGKTDDFDQTIDYVDIFTITKETVEEGQFNLMEGMATAILDQICSSYDLEQITVRVRKPHPPVGGLMDCLEVEVKGGANRSRSSAEAELE